MLPVLRARVTQVRGKAVTLENLEDVRGRGSLAREYTVTYRPGLEANERIVAGRFWDGTPSSQPEISIEEGIRERFKINVGDDVRFDVLGQPIVARVTSVRQVNWRDGRAGGFMFVFRPGVLDAAPHGFISPVRGPADVEARARLQRDLVARFPNVSVIDIREVLDTVRGVIANVTLGVTVVGGLVLFTGVLILVGAVAMTKYRRVYEAAILKTLGASSRLVGSVLLVEYGLLGLLAGAIGAAGGAALSWAISRYVIETAWRPPWSRPLSASSSRRCSSPSSASSRASTCCAESRSPRCAPSSVPADPELAAWTCYHLGLLSPRRARGGESSCMDVSGYKDALLRKKGELSAPAASSRCRRRWRTTPGRATWPTRPAATTRCTSP